MFYLPSKRGYFATCFSNMCAPASTQYLSFWSYHMIFISRWIFTVPPFSELFWMNILKNLSGHTYKRTYDIWLKAFFLCHRWCQVIADSGQSWYIQVSLQTLLFSFECVEGSALTPTLCLQNPKHRHYGSHWCGEDNDHREDALLLWLHESTWRCVGWQK